MAAGEKLDVDLETRKEVQDWDGKKDLLRPIWLQERYELAENRINLLSDAESATNPLELLGLSSETASKAAVEWKITNLGCLLHYKYMPPDEQHQQSAKKAFDGEPLVFVCYQRAANKNSSHESGRDVERRKQFARCCERLEWGAGSPWTAQISIL